jgi:hypothetical protein
MRARACRPGQGLAVKNIGSFSARARTPVLADVLIDVWAFEEGHCGIELNIHPDDIEDVSTCVLITGAALADLAEAISLVPGSNLRKRDRGNVIEIGSMTTEGFVADESRPEVERRRPDEARR